ncbi:12332_t:CDS:2 [Dentiscutata erythropus]|uniref:12332_t:CDS:1 n=1 Tax=Dentiscutata erythropus TaxID=1348616 RepID=A0A9N9D5W8_9GLOM|nr:12332_t:CDS:2 [Dentiscutata erythropus]
MDPTIEVDEIKEYDTEQLVAYLQSVKTLKLDEGHLSILSQEQYTGEDFLKITREELHDVGFRRGPSRRLAEFAETCSEKQERQEYSSIRSLKDVLKDYNIDSDNISKIPRFEPQIHDFRDDYEYFQNCISNILIRIKSYGELCVNSNEKMRREYVSTILHTALRIAEAGSDKKFKMDVEYEVNGKKYYGSTDYAIMESKSENLICITEDKIDRSIQESIAQNIRQLESSHDVNKKKRKRGENGEFDYLYGIITSARDWYFLLHNPGEISLSKTAPFTIEYREQTCDKESDEYKNLYKNTKKVLSIIAGLLLDKIADSESETKRRKVNQFRSNGN